MRDQRLRFRGERLFVASRPPIQRRAGAVDAASAISKPGRPHDGPPPKPSPYPILTPCTFKFLLNPQNTPLAPAHPLVEARHLTLERLEGEPGRRPRRIAQRFWRPVAAGRCVLEREHGSRIRCGRCGRRA